MNITEILKAAGLDDAAIAKIQEAMKENKIFTASEENLDARYGELKEQHDGQAKQLKEALALIETMKADTKGQEDLQKKIGESQARMTQLEEENKALRAEAGMERLLLAAGAKQADLDYLKFQWRKKGEIAMDEDGKIKDGEGVVTALKAQCPAQFESGEGRKYNERKLPTGDDGDTKEPGSLEEALRMQYENETT